MHESPVGDAAGRLRGGLVDGETVGRWSVVLGWNINVWYLSATVPYVLRRYTVQVPVISTCRNSSTAAASSISGSWDTWTIVWHHMIVLWHHGRMLASLRGLNDSIERLNPPRRAQGRLPQLRLFIGRASPGLSCL